LAKMIRQSNFFGTNFDNATTSVALELDGDAKILSYEEYTPYGVTSYFAESRREVPKRYRYNRKEKDEESGLYYYGLRYYAPSIGRWTSCDPLPYLNLYVYVSCDPINLTDSIGACGTEENKGKEEKDNKRKAPSSSSSESQPPKSQRAETNETASSSATSTSNSSPILPATTLSSSTAASLLPSSSANSSSLQSRPFAQSFVPRQLQVPYPQPQHPPPPLMSKTSVKGLSSPSDAQSSASSSTTTSVTSPESDSSNPSSSQTGAGVNPTHLQIAAQHVQLLSQDWDPWKGDEDDYPHSRHLKQSKETRFKMAYDAAAGTHFPNPPSTNYDAPPDDTPEHYPSHLKIGWSGKISSLPYDREIRFEALVAGYWAKKLKTYTGRNDVRALIMYVLEHSTGANYAERTRIRVTPTKKII
jgi:RHS repeat-associated protein